MGSSEHSLKLAQILKSVDNLFLPCTTMRPASLHANEMECNLGQNPPPGLRCEHFSLDEPELDEQFELHLGRWGHHALEQHCHGPFLDLGKLTPDEGGLSPLAGRRPRSSSWPGTASCSWNINSDSSESSGTFTTGTGAETIGSDTKISGDRMPATGTSAETQLGTTSASGNITFDSSVSSGTFARETGAETIGGNPTISGDMTSATGTSAVTLQGGEFQAEQIMNESVLESTQLTVEGPLIQERWLQQPGEPLAEEIGEMKNVEGKSLQNRGRRRVLRLSAHLRAVPGPTEANLNPQVGGDDARTVNHGITQYVKIVGDDLGKMGELRRLMQKCEPTDSLLVICETNRSAVFLARQLNNFEHVPTMAFHGDLEQSERETALHAFETGRANVLVATDKMARGLESKGITGVVSWDAPGNSEEYVHRSGHLGRTSRKGSYTTFLLGSETEKAGGIFLEMRKAGCELPSELAQLERGFSVSGMAGEKGCVLDALHDQGEWTGGPHFCEGKEEGSTTTGLKEAGYTATALKEEGSTANSASATLSDEAPACRPAGAPRTKPVTPGDEIVIYLKGNVLHGPGVLVRRSSDPEMNTVPAGADLERARKALEPAKQADATDAEKAWTTVRRRRPRNGGHQRPVRLEWTSDWRRRPCPPPRRRQAALAAGARA